MSKKLTLKVLFEQVVDLPKRDQKKLMTALEAYLSLNKKEEKEKDFDNLLFK